MDTLSNENRTQDLMNEEAFWERIKQAYVDDTNTRDPALTKEIILIRGAMTKYFCAGCRYTIIDFLGVGGVGIVFRAWDNILHTNRAIKIARPIEGKEDMIKGLVEEEITRLQEVSHPNIISIFDVSEIESSTGKLPFYAMTFLEGALSGSKYFLRKRSTKQLLKFIDGFFAGVVHLHSIYLLHLDLKPSNVFVREDGFAVIGDLGGTRKITGDSEEEILITCTTRYAHPELNGLTSLTSAGEDNRRRGTIKRRQLKFEFDRFAVGLSLYEIIKKFELINPTELSSYQKKYLHLQATRLLDGRVHEVELPLGLTGNTLVRIKYNSIEEAQIDYDKFLGRVNLINEIPELTPSADSIIQVSRGRRTRLTPRLTRLLDSSLMRRLATISQLGLVRLVYPGATHTRFEHSLGAFSNAANYVRSLYYDPINPFFRQVMSKDDLLAVLLAAILHDIGQYQHAHDLQDVDPAIFKHEGLTISLLNGTWPDHDYLTKPLRKLLLEDWKIAPDRIIRILETNPNTLTADIKDRILHTIISVPLDVDKLDYLIRDSDNCQTVFGNGLDHSRLLSILTIVYQRKGASDEQYFALGIHEKGRVAAESVGFIRFQMYNAVYWHHTVRSAKAMLQRAAFEWIAPSLHDGYKKDMLKRELYDFVLNFTPKKKKTSPGQMTIFGEEPSYELVKIGYSTNPHWTGLSHSDFSCIQWLYTRTNDLGKELLESIAKRALYKRVFVISALQSKTLWEKMQRELKDYESLKMYSESLRIAIKKRVDYLINQSSSETQHFYVTGVGDDTSNVITASRIIGKVGSVLIDMPKNRIKEELHFFPEDLHWSQKEEFESPSILGVSELWQVVSDRLHETAGNIRIFVHPEIAILKSAKSIDGKRILDSALIEEEIKKIFDID